MGHGFNVAKRNKFVPIFFWIFPWGDHQPSQVADLQICHIPSGNLTFCDIENDPVEIVDFPMKNGGSFHGFLLTFTRG